MILNDWYEQYKKFSIVWRSKYFQPVLKLLADLKITPDQITFFRLIFLVPVIYYFYWLNLWGVLIFYLIFWFLDLFDGALARYLRAENDKGRFLDTIIDNFAYGVLMVGFISLDIAWGWLLAFNILAEISVQVLAIIQKQRTKPSDWLIKAEANLPYFKTISHLTLIFYLLGHNYINSVFLCLNFGLVLTFFYYLWLIKQE
jgi:phosphatidylglycerophosphate synthase